MDSSRPRLPASLAINTPHQHIPQVISSSHTPDSGWRLWAENRYVRSSHDGSQRPAVEPAAAQEIRSRQGSDGEAEERRRSLMELFAQFDEIGHSSDELVELPALESRPSTRQTYRQSGFLVSPLSTRRRSLDSNVSSTWDGHLRISQIDTPVDTFDPYQTTAYSESDTFMSVNSLAPQPLSIRSQVVTGSVAQRPWVYTASDAHMAFTAEPESVISPLDAALFATATGSLELSFPPPTISTASTTSSVPARPFLNILAPSSSAPAAQPSVQPRPRQQNPPSTSLQPPLQHSGSHHQRSRSAPSRRPSTRITSTSTSTATDQPTQRIMLHHTHSHNTLLLLQSLGLDDCPVDYDDELPDYETSQAQAHAARRVEATRRARELELGWQRSWQRLTRRR